MKIEVRGNWSLFQLAVFKVATKEGCETLIFLMYEERLSKYIQQIGKLAWEEGIQIIRLL